jgi:hypothetical protein
MTRKPRTKRPARPGAPAAFTRFQKLTRALLGVPKEELDRKRAEYEHQSKDEAGKPKESRAEQPS